MESLPSGFPDTCTGSQESEGEAEPQPEIPELRAFLSLKHRGFHPNQLLWSSRNLCFPPGSPLTCWLLLEMLLPLHTFQFPNLKHEGNYADLFSRLPWEQLRGEALYGLDGISKLKEHQNKILIPWLSHPFTHHASKICPAAGKYFSVLIVFCHRGM